MFKHKSNGLHIVGLLSLIGICLGYVYVPRLHAETMPANFINGGIGIEEANQIRSKGAAYPLHLFFTEGQQANFITNVELTILNENGNEVLKNADAGPLFFIRLHAGKYAIKAQYNGVAITKQVLVRQGLIADVFLNWQAVNEGNYE